MTKGGVITGRTDITRSSGLKRIAGARPRSARKPGRAASCSTPTSMRQDQRVPRHAAASAAREAGEAPDAGIGQLADEQTQTRDARRRRGRRRAGRRRPGRTRRPASPRRRAAMAPTMNGVAAAPAAAGQPVARAGPAPRRRRAAPPIPGRLHRAGARAGDPATPSASRARRLRAPATSSQTSPASAAAISSAGAPRREPAAAGDQRPARAAPATAGRSPSAAAPASRGRACRARRAVRLPTRTTAAASSERGRQRERDGQPRLPCRTDPCARRVAQPPFLTSFVQRDSRPVRVAEEPYFAKS